jgi:hypothetical protein
VRCILLLDACCRPSEVAFVSGKILCGPPQLCDDIARVINAADARKFPMVPQKLCSRSLVAGVALGALVACVGVKLLRR